MIELIKISKRYETNFKVIEAVKEISFFVEKESFTGIVGMSGCGKTTLLKIIGGILDSTSGEVVIDRRTSGCQRDKRDFHKFGIVFQDAALLPWRNVVGNIQLPLEVASEENSKFKADELIKMVGLEGFEEALPHQLSAGMRARVAIARALIFHPRILLMDEPFSSLDEIIRGNLNIELLKIWKEIKSTVVFVTHNISEAVFLSDKIIVLSPRPGKVKKIIDVNLPRPRNQQTRRMPEFAELVENIRDILLQ